MQDDSIPMRRASKRDAGKGDDNELLSEFCVTVTASTTSSASFISAEAGKDSTLQKTVSDLITQVMIDAGGGRRHVNQTAYPPVQDSIIAVSIETTNELSGIDPVLQLGIWAAAWFKRLCSLRRELFATGVLEITDEQLLQQQRQREQQKRLVTVPLVAVVGHQWDMYFACFDNAALITLYGPVVMGNTSSILEIYVVVASLKAVKDWISTVFKEAMEDWFMCEAGARGDDLACVKQQL
ncbi:hypothetical protein F5B20DRAFT_593680 [Whalleya microplaca]|nr:hypothetical protein F5B20DRAFT_593680 [Whalleya microplaca]